MHNKKPFIYFARRRYVCTYAGMYVRRVAKRIQGCGGRARNSAAVFVGVCLNSRTMGDQLYGAKAGVIFVMHL